jgi:hypothetical protein
MRHDDVTGLLTDFRSYRYAANNGADYIDSSLINVPRMYSERMKNRNAWDATRYSRIVNMTQGAVNEVLSDDQRAVISLKYLERNKLSLKEIAAMKKCDPSTVSRWHTEAIRRLSKALEPISEEYREITNIDHMFDAEKEAETA